MRYHSVVLCCFILLISACSANSPGLVTKSNETGNLKLTVSTPTKVRAEEQFKVEVSLQNVGNEMMDLTYAEPAIRIYILDDKEESAFEYGSFAAEVPDQLDPNESIRISYPVTLKTWGTYELNVLTSPLTVNGQSFQGAGNDRYIEYMLKKNPNLDYLVEYQKTAIMIEEPIPIQVVP
jgi:hypothetical protein